MDFCTLKMYMVNTKKYVSVLSTGAGNFNPKNVLESVSISLDQTTFLDVCK